MNKIKKLLTYILNTPLYLLAKIIRKNKNIWIFGAGYGDKYADNSKYLFEYVNEYHPEIRAIWLTKNNKAYELIKSKGYEVYYRYSLKSIILGLKAKYTIFVHSNSIDCMPFINNKRTKIIQLWHGIPLKKIGFDDNLLKYNKTTLNIKKFIFPFVHEEYAFIIASSQEDKIKFMSAFKTSNVRITGYPRNDLLCNKETNNTFTITYLPTFRDSIGYKIDLFSDFNFNLELWDKSLSKSSIKLNIKMHPLSKPTDELLTKFNVLENINFLDEIDVAEILPKTDILITDYSSVYFDYLLRDKPIIFAPFDYDNYITKDREFYYNYNEVTPGPKCKDWNEVLEWIKKFKNDPTIYADERQKVRDRFHKYQDGKNCERVYNEIIKL